MSDRIKATEISAAELTLLSEAGLRTPIEIGREVMTLKKTIVALEGIERERFIRGLPEDPLVVAAAARAEALAREADAVAAFILGIRNRSLN